MSVALNELPSPAAQRSRIRNVLLATDLSPTSTAAANEAISLCADVGARLVVVNVIDPRAGVGRAVLPAARAARVDQLRDEREARLAVLVGQARQAGVEALFLVWTGEAGQSIVSAAEAEGADLIVIGTRALDRAGRFLLGSVSDYVVNHSPCAVLIARQRADAPPAERPAATRQSDCQVRPSRTCLTKSRRRK